MSVEDQLEQTYNGYLAAQTVIGLLHTPQWHHKTQNSTCGRALRKTIAHINIIWKEEKASRVANFLHIWYFSISLVGLTCGENWWWTVQLYQYFCNLSRFIRAVLKPILTVLMRENKSWKVQLCKYFRDLTQPIRAFHGKQNKSWTVQLTSIFVT